MRCRKQGALAIAYGLGLVSACIFPEGLIVFIAAIVLIVLGIAVCRY